MLVLGSEEVAPRVIVRARAIGVMPMRDEKGQDDKIIAVHVDDPEYAGLQDVGDVPPHRLRVIERFFLDYKALEGKEVAVDKPLGAQRALRVLREAIELYERSQPELKSGKA